MLVAGCQLRSASCTTARLPVQWVWCRRPVGRKPPFRRLESPARTLGPIITGRPRTASRSCWCLLLLRGGWVSWVGDDEIITGRALRLIRSGSPQSLPASQPIGYHFAIGAVSVSAPARFERGWDDGRGASAAGSWPLSIGPRAMLSMIIHLLASETNK